MSTQVDLNKIYDDMRNGAISNLVAFIPFLVNELKVARKVIEAARAIAISSDDIGAIEHKLAENLIESLKKLDGGK